VRKDKSILFSGFWVLGRKMYYEDEKRGNL
jgi:hypothetical protein